MSEQAQQALGLLREQREAAPVAGMCSCPPHPDPAINGPGDWDPNCKLHTPAPAAVVNRERVAEVLAKHLIAGDGEYGGDWENLQHRKAYLEVAEPFVEALFSSGVLRDEAQVKAEVAEEIVSEIGRCAEVLVTESDASGNYLVAAVLQKAADIAREIGGVQ